MGTSKQATDKKGNKIISRAQAEKKLAGGADANQFTKHANYHVRAKAWKKLGKPEMGNAEEHAKFLAGIHHKEVSKEVPVDLTEVTPLDVSEIKAEK